MFGLVDLSDCSVEEWIKILEGVPLRTKAMLAALYGKTLAERKAFLYQLQFTGAETDSLAPWVLIPDDGFVALSLAVAGSNDVYAEEKVEVLYSRVRGIYETLGLDIAPPAIKAGLMTMLSGGNTDDVKNAILYYLVLH